jgi:hypothetical protein
MIEDRKLKSGKQRHGSHLLGRSRKKYRTDAGNLLSLKDTNHTLLNTLCQWLVNKFPGNLTDNVPDRLPETEIAFGIFKWPYR